MYVFVHDNLKENPGLSIYHDVTSTARAHKTPTKELPTFDVWWTSWQTITHSKMRWVLSIARIFWQPRVLACNLYYWKIQVHWMRLKISHSFWTMTSLLGSVRHNGTLTLQWKTHSQIQFVVFLSWHASAFWAKDETVQFSAIPAWLQDVALAAAAAASLKSEVVTTSWTESFCNMYT